MNRITAWIDARLSRFADEIVRHTIDRANTRIEGEQ